jgi:rfaE bifunctional protein nucleotidyltransferase chain/domain/rfaE bifunctional protein kinase chain/domain
VKRVTVVGDALLDRDVEGSVDRVCPDAPAPVVDAREERTRPGGAALAATLAARDGASVTFVTALARDDAAQELRALLEEAGVTVVAAGLDGWTPEKVRVIAAGRPILRIDRGGAPGRVGRFDRDAQEAVEDAAAVLVADYGRGVAPAAARLVSTLDASVPIVWDPHPRGVVATPGARIVTPNERELFTFVPGTTAAGADGYRRVVHAAHTLAQRWRAAAVATTLGARGALLVQGPGPPLMVPAVAATGDACGAGDRFASAAAVALATGALVSEAVEHAVHAATDFVAAGGAAAYDRAGATARGPRVRAADVAARVRAAGGVVVATGGCFDLLHAGHVATLQAARRMGDCLIVLVNSDPSIRRLKGPGRPLQPVADRVAVLEALDCVDAVEVFDGDTPVRALEALRPHVFAKGGDYAVDDLPESRVLARTGGQVVVLPYLAGRSTTNLMQEVLRRGR